MSTVGKNMEFNVDGSIQSKGVNKIFTGKGVKAFYANGEYTVLDNNLIKSFNYKPKNSQATAGARFQKGNVVYKNTNAGIYASKAVSNTVMKKAFNKLFSKFNINATLLTSEAIEEEFGSIYKDKAGWTTAEGEIVINLDVATLDTPLHEFGGHIYLSHLKNIDVETYAQVIEMSLNHEITPVVQEMYPELEGESLGDEVFSQLFGQVNQGKLLDENSLNLWDKIVNIANGADSFLGFFKQAFNAVFGNDVDFTISEDDSLMDIMNNLGNDIIYGEGSALNGLNDSIKGMIETSRDPSVNTEGILKKLETLKQIRVVCT